MGKKVPISFLGHCSIYTLQVVNDLQHIAEEMGSNALNGCDFASGLSLNGKMELKINERMIMFNMLIIHRLSGWVV